MAGFVLETNGRSSSAFPRPSENAPDQLRSAFARMDGERLFAFLLWEVPGDRTIDDGLRGVAPEQFIQCAGSAEALTVEIRELDECGVHVLSTLGREGEDPGPCDVPIAFRSNTKTVHHNERWSAVAAADVFLEYRRTNGKLPAGIARRELERFLPSP